MPIPCDIKQREWESWAECPEGSGLPAKRVKACSSVDDPVYVTPVCGETRIFSNEVNAVVSGANQTIISYTVPAGKISCLKEVAGTSCNWSKFTVEIDGVVKKSKNTYGGDFNVEFEFYDLELVEGQVVTLKALHSRPHSADLQGSIIVGEKNE